MEDKEQYEELRTYKNRTWQAEAKIITQRKVIIALLVFLLIIFARAGSYRIALIANGARETYVLAAGKSDFPRFGTILGHGQFAFRIQNSSFSNWLGRNSEYRIVFSRRRGDNASFIRMRRNRLGFWFAENMGYEHPVSNGVTAFWMGQHSRGYIPSPIHRGNMSSTFHFLYFNTNATSAIHIDNELIPPNISVRVMQWGNSYLLHAVHPRNHEGPSVMGLDFPELVAEFTTQE